jgi:nitroreductase
VNDLLLASPFINNIERKLMESREDIVFDAIYARRSIRLFDENTDVEKEKIIKLLKAAMAAPSACNIQPWDFIVISEQETIKEIKKSISNYGDYNTKNIIVICGNNEYIPWKDNGIVDCSAAMENIMIAAPTLGLGTVCIGGFDRSEIKNILGIPPNVEAIGMLYLGYPKEVKKPRTKYIEEAVHWEKYDITREQRAREGNILIYGPESSI